MKSKLDEKVERYYQQTFAKFGDSAKGVDWKNESSQNLRFERILRSVNGNESFSLLDVGCGTGSIIESLKASAGNFSYLGIDLVQEMIECALVKFANEPRVNFSNCALASVQSQFDYVIASGIFNVKQESGDAEWEKEFFASISKMFGLAKKAAIFNVLTSYVDFKVDHLFYSDPLKTFDYCKRNLSRFVSLDHSYDLYEYTITISRNV